jgi:hypothetical protein
VPGSRRRVPAKQKEGKGGSGAFRTGKEMAATCLPELRGGGSSEQPAAEGGVRVAWRAK